MNYPKISIVTPSFNQGEFLEETICSILEQNYPNLEYIIVDGGSTDKSVEIIKKYEPHLSYWISEPDKGQTDAIQKGFNKATGDYINWINSDDLLKPNALHEIKKFIAENPGVDFVYGNWDTIDVNSQLIENRYPKNNTQFRGIYEFPYAQQACFYKRSAVNELGGFDLSFDFTMDFDLFVRFALCKKMGYCEQNLASFREHNEAKSGLEKYLKIWRKDSFRVFSKLLRTAKLKEEIELAKSFGIYVDEATTYSISPDQKNIATIQKAFPYFAARWAHYFYQNRAYKKANAIIRFVKKQSEEAYKEYHLGQIQWRSKLQINRLRF